MKSSRDINIIFLVVFGYPNSMTVDLSVRHTSAIIYKTNWVKIRMSVLLFYLEKLYFTVNLSNISLSLKTQIYVYILKG